MSLLKFLKGEFIEVVHWEDSSQDTMVYKFPIEGKQQIKQNAQLIVRPSQVAIFVYEGQIADMYEPGKYTLNTDTMPILTSLANWKYKFENHFKTDVYFVNTKQFINQKWGTTNPIMMRDQDFGMIRLRGFGMYSFRVKDPLVFLKEVFGSNPLYTVDKVNQTLKSLIISTVSDAIAESNIAAMDLSTQYDELGRVTQGRLDERFMAYGLEASDFAIENLSLPESVEKAIDKRAEMGAVGDLNQYMKYQSAEAIRDAAQNEGGGMAGLGAGIGAGAGLGQMMAEAMKSGNAQSQQGTSQASKSTEETQVQTCRHCNQLVGKNYKFCPECGGSMLHQCIHCEKEIAEEAKFCSYCGGKQSQTMNCKKCQYELSEGAKFCPECGTGVE